MMAELPVELRPSETCLRCESSRVALGRIAYGTTVTPLPQRPTPALAWEASDFLLHRTTRICLACGLIWGSFDTGIATRVIRACGKDDLKQRVLEGAANLPVPAAARAPEGARCRGLLIQPI